MPKYRMVNSTATRYLQYLKGVQGAVVAINQDFDVTYINDYGAQMLKLTPGKIIRKMKCYDLFKTEKCKTPKCPCAVAMKTKKSASTETKSELNMNLWLTGTPIVDSEGTVGGAIEYVVDITSLTQETEKNKRQVQVLEAVQTPVLSIDKDFNVTYINSYGATMLGNTADKLVGKKCHDLLKTTDCKKASCVCAIAMKTKKPAVSETVSNGAMNIQSTGSPLFDKDGNVIGAVEYIADISEMKQMLETTQGLVQASTDVANNVENYSIAILETAEGIGVMGAQSAQAATKLSNSMEQVMAASQNVSDGAQSLSKLAQDTSKNVQELMQKMSDVNLGTKEVNKIVETSNQVAKDASEGGKLALKSLEAIKAASSDVEQTIGEVNSSVKNVAGLADDISQIAGQVNMLALNAAIEAARAGEAGRGFAVVADAVKQLAGQAGTAAKTAVESIGDITKAGERAGGMSKSAGQAAIEGDLNVNEAVTSSQKVANSMDKILGVTQNLGASVQESVRYLEDVGNAIEQVASFSEQSASASEEASASIEEQTAATEQVAVASAKVQEEVAKAVDLAKKIVQEVKNFRDMWQ